MNSENEEKEAAFNGLPKLRLFQISIRYIAFSLFTKLILTQLCGQFNTRKKIK